ncbi:MAG: PAS domain S-box protein [Thermoplasmata archaeon]|nr:PAS domain S-box protein [Thermoplasmata archaeon]
MSDALRVLVVGDRTAALDEALRSLGGPRDAQVRVTDWNPVDPLPEGGWDLVVKEPDGGPSAALDLLASLLASGSDASFIVHDPDISTDDLAALFRAGADDFIGTNDAAALAIAIREGLARRGARRVDALEIDGLRQSEEKFRSLAKNAPDIIHRCKIHPTLSLEFVSDAVASVTGYTPDELYLREGGLLSVVHPEDEHFLRDMIERPDTAGDVRRMRLVHKSGEAVWVDMKCTPVQSEEGRVVALEGVIRNVTEKVKYESLLAEFASIVEHSEDAIIGKTIDGTITSWNEGARKLFGYESHEAVGRSVSMVIPDERMGEEYELLSELREGRSVKSYETVRVKKGGKRISVSVSLSPIKAKDGTVTGISAIARDITEKMMLNEELRRRTEEAETATFKARTYLDFISHDLANMLTPVSSYAEMVSTGADVPDRVRGYAEKIVGMVSKTASFMENVRRLSSSEREVASTLGHVDMRKVLAEAERNIRVLFADKRIDISYEIGEHAEFAARGEGYIEDIVYEVLSNAVKHTPGMNVDISVSLRQVKTEDGDRFCHLEISDHGPGMPDDVKELLSADAFQEDRAGQRGVASTISLLALVMEQIGGSLSIYDRVEGHRDQGTKIIIRVPRGTA